MSSGGQGHPLITGDKDQLLGSGGQDLPLITGGQNQLLITGDQDQLLISVGLVQPMITGPLRFIGREAHRKEKGQSTGTEALAIL